MSSIKNSVCLLNWNELDVSGDSVRRLLKEPEVDEVIVVDNGSTDGSKEYFRKRAGLIIVPDVKSDSGIKELIFKTGNQKLKFIDWPDNSGSSVGRNRGITISKGEDIFLLDGDILYVPGTIKEYQKILDKYPDAYCVGQNSMRLLNETGCNGAYNILDADMSMGDDYVIEDWFPMAWTQYGLFRGDLLRKTKFVEIPPFNQAGYGLEDDWLHHELVEQGYISLSCTQPIYYHYHHAGIRELYKTDLGFKTKERKKVFEKRWGKNKSWESNIKLNNPKRTYRTRD